MRLKNGRTQKQKAEKASSLADLFWRSSLYFCHFFCSEAKIVFSKDWKETLYGYLLPGEEVRIEYAASRLPNRDTRYGQRAWNIFAEIKYSEGGNVHSVLLEGPDEEDMMTTTLEIPPNATSFIIWFKHHGYYNGYSYDSNFQKNYKFPFNQIIFTGDWQEYVKGALRPGGKFQVVYDSIRLPWRDIGYLGRNFISYCNIREKQQKRLISTRCIHNIRTPQRRLDLNVFTTFLVLGMGYAWNIFAHVKFSDNGPDVQQLLHGGNQGGNPIMTTVYEIPEDAEKIIMWFRFSGYRNPKKYDSNYGQNYHFALSNNN